MQLGTGRLGRAPLRWADGATGPGPPFGPWWGAASSSPSWLGGRRTGVSRGNRDRPARPRDLPCQDQGQRRRQGAFGVLCPQETFPRWIFLGAWHRSSFCNCPPPQLLPPPGSPPRRSWVQRNPCNQHPPSPGAASSPRPALRSRGSAPTSRPARRPGLPLVRPAAQRGEAPPDPPWAGGETETN